jgi:hypothetical protein
MAIIIEEQKRRINWFALALIVFVVAIIGAAIYYLFFASTPLVERVVPPRLQSLQELSLIELQPEKVISDSRFQILKQYVDPIEVPTSSIGKTDPFAK